jgi:UDP-3-O-[3-hydroxymyristoyl] glucosamine N-acyltransferase
MDDNKKYYLEDILPFVKGDYRISGNSQGKYFTHLWNVFEAGPHALVFISSNHNQKQEWANRTKAQIILCDFSIEGCEDLPEGKCFLMVEKPKELYARIGNHLFRKEISYGIHPSAIIHPKASIHVTVAIGPFTYIGESSINEGTVIDGHCYIYDHVKIGKNVRIQAGCIIGAPGFGYQKNDKNEYENFPHVGGVIIEDDVEIGANTCIDKGALGDTRIQSGTKINNLAHIAHNTVIGKKSILNAHVMVCGSVVIGDDCWVAPSAALRDQIRMGSRAKLGMGAVALKDIPDDETWIGVPARPVGPFLEIQKKWEKKEGQRDD